MTKKDPNISENIDLDKNNEAGSDQHKEVNETSEPKPDGHTEIKNAHATGDGAYGRSDKSVLDNENDNENNGAKPAY